MNIPTLNETLKKQTNLEVFCTDRPLHTTEIFSPNAFYGIDHVLKTYSGLPGTYALKGVVPHGVYLTKEKVWDPELSVNLPVVFCYPSYREEIYVKNSRKAVIPTASPFLYALQLAKTASENQRIERKGTIFFPVHSTHHITVEIDYKKIIDILIKLDQKYQPINICMYWKDILLGRHLIFQESGFRVFSAGHVFDKNFLFHLYHLCLIHKYSASNEIGSYTFFSIKSGCYHLLLESIDYSMTGEERFLKEVSYNPHSLNSIVEQLQKSFSLDHLSYFQQEQIADHFLNTQYFQSPNCLRKQLLRSEIMDKFGFVIYHPPKDKKYIIPPYYRRLYQVMKAKSRSVVKRIVSIMSKFVIGFAILIIKILII